METPLTGFLQLPMFYLLVPPPPPPHTHTHSILCCYGHVEGHYEGKYTARPVHGKNLKDYLPLPGRRRILVYLGYPAHFSGPDCAQHVNSLLGHGLQAPYMHSPPYPHTHTSRPHFFKILICPIVNV